MSDLCVECGTVAHPFDCRKHATHLTVYDLWDQPVEAADFIYIVLRQLPTPTI